MDNEYDLLNQNNEKYSIKISGYKARLRAIEKELLNETLTVNSRILDKVFFFILPMNFRSVN